ncbi:hypothetical protein DFJ73DRAFT_182904 [Zopfochytrium polystomum]|nr:hypothetical protein DFJ73DRAFT_182904 [Zopfochytrium polystomum]
MADLGGPASDFENSSPNPPPDLGRGSSSSSTSSSTTTITIGDLDFVIPVPIDYAPLHAAHHAEDFPTTHPQPPPLLPDDRAIDGIRIADRAPPTVPIAVDDDDFEPLPQAVSPVSSKKRRLEPSPRKLEEDDEKATECKICFEPVTNSGHHVMSCLDCGHIFGKSCIRNWLRKGGSSASCPTCRKRAHLKDIRNIYVDRLIAIDNTALVKLAAERDQLRAELGLKRAEADMWRSKYFQAVEHELWRKPLQCVGAAVLAENKSVRVGASVGNSHKAWAACSRDPSDFGVSLLDLTDLRTRQYVPLHSSMIRDVKMRRRECSSQLLMSISIDKTLKITSLRDNQETCKIHLPSGGWSCAFDPVDTNIAIAGLASRGIVQLFDVRNPAKPLTVLDDPSLGGIGKSIHSLHCFHRRGRRVLFGASLMSPFIAEELGPDSYRFQSFDKEAVSLNASAVCTSAFLDEDSNDRFISTWRHSEETRYVCGSIGPPPLPTAAAAAAAEAGQDAEGFQAFQVQEQYAGPRQSVMSRSRTFKHAGQQTAATGDESSHCARLHALLDGTSMEGPRLNAESNSIVMDTLPVGGSVVVLTENRAHVWRK